MTSLPRVYVIGDSISLQYGDMLKTLLEGRFKYNRKSGSEEALRNLDLPAGANGGDSTRVLEHLTAWKQAGGLPADLLLLNCGLHDIKTHPATGRRQVDLPSYRANLRAIVELVQHHMHPALVWMRTTPCDETVHNKPHMDFHRFAADCETYNAAADHIMNEAGVPSIDLHDFTLRLGDDLYCDHVHFHERVRRLQAAFLAGWLTHWKQDNWPPYSEHSGRSAQAI